MYAEGKKMFTSLCVKRSHLRMAGWFAFCVAPVLLAFVTYFLRSLTSQGVIFLTLKSHSHWWKPYANTTKDGVCSSTYRPFMWWCTLYRVHRVRSQASQALQEEVGFPPKPGHFLFNEVTDSHLYK